MTKHITQEETVERAQEYATSLSDLIEPSDVNGSANCWEEIPQETLDMEIYESIDIIMSESSWHSKLSALLYERAVSVYCSDLPRVPMGHLTFDTHKEAIAEGYQPYKCSGAECRAHAQEVFTTVGDLPAGCYEEAYSDVSKGLYNGMQPTCEC